MNYHKHYSRLVERARDRTLSGYSERHHVVPRCMGGGDAASNLVRLTPEEHYVAHQLLVKMHPAHRGLIRAAKRMTDGVGDRRAGNKLYAWLRQRFIEAQRSDERNAAATKARWADPAYAARMAALSRKRWADPQHAARIAAASCQGHPSFPQLWQFKFPHPVVMTCRHRLTGPALP